MNACVRCQTSVKVARMAISGDQLCTRTRCIVSQKLFHFNLNLSRNLLNLMRLFETIHSYVPLLSACRRVSFISILHTDYMVRLNSQLFHAFSISRECVDICVGVHCFSSLVFLLFYFIPFEFVRQSSAGCYTRAASTFNSIAFCRCVGVPCVLCVPSGNVF